MGQVVIKVAANGPLLVTGDFQLIDAAGGVFPTNPDKPTALCRCGQSSRKPFCDGTHRGCQFVSEVAAPPPAG